MYLWDLPFFVIGILFLFLQRKGKWWIVPIWLLVGIIPAAVARETPHALRTEVTLPMWQIFTAYGFITITQMMKRYQQVVVSGLFILLFLFLGYYLHGYYTHYSKEFSAEWQYGYKDAIDYVKDHEKNYNIVYISGLERPYIYTLFYLKYPPEQFRQTAVVTTDAFGFIHVMSFDKYKFIDNPGQAHQKGKALFITSAALVPQKAKVLKIFNFLDGSAELVAFTK